MNQARILWPLAFLVSGLLYAFTDNEADAQIGSASWTSGTLMAVGFLLLLATWRGERISMAWHATGAWLRSATKQVSPPARRITIRIRCQR
jgi:hypothetical protein